MGVSGVPADIANTIREFINRARMASSHPAKLLILSNLLRNLFGVELEELIPGIEKKLGSKILGIRGRADLVFSNMVFEVKMDLGRELRDAEEQLIKYLQALYEQRPGERHIGIATDLLRFIAYAPTISNGRVDGLREIGSIDVERSSPQDFVLWLDSFVFSKPRIRPSALDLKWRFGPGSPTYFIVVEELENLWKEVEGERDVRLKLDLWSRNMEIVYGSRPEPRSFIDHTYLVTLVKLIVYFRLSGEHVVREEGIKRVLSGEYFSSYGIENLVEEDFFTWIMNPKIYDRSLRIVCGLAKELLRYDLSQIDEDFFKEIYQEIVERGQRHRIGEYYTPEWLVQLILRDVMSLWRGRGQGFPRVLDPACGSGTFLCNLIRMAREELRARGEEPGKILDFILNNIVGVDVNPLATIIARANYLIALGDLVEMGRRIIIPVYVADSIRIPRVINTLATRGSANVVEVYEIDANDHRLQIPKSLVVRKGLLGPVLETLKAATRIYKARRNRSEALELFRREASKLLSSGEFEVMERTLETIIKLTDEGLDSIWVFVLSNIYAPIALMESKFDMVVGNPPWIAMRYIENKEYQEFLKQQVLAYELLESSDVHLFTHMEAATLFFCRSSDLYLRNGGLIAFVMPRSVLTGAFHHTRFRRFRKPAMRLLKVFDLEGVSPLFNVPSCVLIAVKEGETEYPVPAVRYSGKLAYKNAHLAEAERSLEFEEYMYNPPAIPDKHSLYHDEVMQGATLVPRNLWFVDFEAHPTLGIDISRPLVRTAEEVSKEAKEPWGDVVLEGNVESEFIYATLLGGDIVPFGYRRLRPVVLPIEPSLSGYRLLDVDELRGRGFPLMASWLERAQMLWEERATRRAIENYPRVISWLDYMGKLSSQNPGRRYVVLYNTSGTNIASCVIDRKSLKAFQVLGAQIVPRGFVAESTTYFYETDDETEAHYLCAVLNSNIINDLIKPLQPRGLYGERHIHRRPFMLPIPRYDKNNPIHGRLAELSKICHAKISSLRFTKKRTASLRKEAEEAIKNELAEIDTLVSRLLGL